MKCTTRELLKRARASDIGERLALDLMEYEAREYERNKQEAMRKARASAPAARPIRRR